MHTWRRLRWPKPVAGFPYDLKPNEAPSRRKRDSKIFKGDVLMIKDWIPLLRVLSCRSPVEIESTHRLIKAAIWTRMMLAETETPVTDYHRKHTGQKLNHSQIVIKVSSCNVITGFWRLSKPMSRPPNLPAHDKCKKRKKKRSDRAHFLL